jgi:hypothetical protein
MKNTIFSVTAVAILTIVGCAGTDGTSETDPTTTPDVGGEAQELAAGNDTLACTIGSRASAAAQIGSVACWTAAAFTAGAPTPVCVFLSSAGVTAAKIVSGAAQCATNCGITGAVCTNIKEVWTKRNTSTLRLVNGGCNKNGEFSVMADVCALGLNRIYSVNAPESRSCVKGKPTGFWALTDRERNYINDKSNCVARGIK